MIKSKQYGASTIFQIVCAKTTLFTLNKVKDYIYKKYIDTILIA